MGKGRWRLLFPASLPLWVLATGAAVAAAPASAPAEPAAVTAPKREAAATGGAHKKDAAKGSVKEGAKETTKDATKEAANDSKKDAAQEAAKDSTKDAAKDPARKDDPRGVSALGPAEANAHKKDETPPVAGAAATPAKKGEVAGATKAGDEPAPPNAPPLKMSSLRDEMSRPPRKDEPRATSHAERERLEHLAAEINKARDGLRQDTARLEAMLAARDAAASVARTAAPATNDSGEPAKKVPSPLDNLAKAIRGMKPEQAAPIISRVDRKLAADVLLRMPGSDAGKVLGVCKPEVAAELAAEIASRAPHAELKR